MVEEEEEEEEEVVDVVVVEGLVAAALGYIYRLKPQIILSCS